MRFGTLYAYWTTEWTGDYKYYAKKVADIGFDGYVVMEPLVKTGGQVGKDIKVWRDLGGGADEVALDANIGKSLRFLRDAFAE